MATTSFSSASHVVVCYDITDDARRLRVSKALENFGERVQFSVFECFLTETDLSVLKHKMEKLISPAEDHVRYYRLCPKDSGGILVDGCGERVRDWDYHVV